MKRLKTIIIFGVSLLLLTNCILEDRSECPSFLSLDLSQVREEVKRIDLWFFDPNGELLLYDSIKKESFDQIYEVPVRKGELDICAWGNIGKRTELSSYQKIDGILKGRDGTLDSLYFYSVNISPSGEFHNETIVMNREFVKLYLYILSYPSDGITMKTELLGSTVGYSIDRKLCSGSLSIEKEPFEEFPQNGKWNKYEFDIPRQEQNEDLAIRLTLNKNDGELVVTTINIGNEIPFFGKESAEEITDLHIIIDYSRMETTIHTTNWIFNPSEYLNI